MKTKKHSIQECDGPCREKHWSELDSVGRIERLRLVFKELQLQMLDSQSNIRDLRRESEEHEHSPHDGKPTIAIKKEPATHNLGWMPKSLSPGNPDDVYI